MWMPSSAAETRPVATIGVAILEVKAVTVHLCRRRWRRSSRACCTYVAPIRLPALAPQGLENHGRCLLRLLARTHLLPLPPKSPWCVLQLYAPAAKLIERPAAHRAVWIVITADMGVADENLQEERQRGRWRAETIPAGSGEASVMLGECNIHALNRRLARPVQ